MSCSSVSSNFQIKEEEIDDEQERIPKSEYESESNVTDSQQGQVVKLEQEEEYEGNDEIDLLMKMEEEEEEDALEIKREEEEDDESDHEISLEIYHKQQATSEFFVCRGCGKGFKSYAGLRDHVFSVHKGWVHPRDNGEIVDEEESTITSHQVDPDKIWRPFICGVCCQTFTTLNRLSCHIELRHNGYIPPNISIYNPYALGRMNPKPHSNQGLKNEDKNRSFTCGGCPSKYRHYQSLQKHIETYHGGKRPANSTPSPPWETRRAVVSPMLRCRYCPQKYWQKEIVNAHVMLKHPEKKQSPQHDVGVFVVCPFCPRKYSQKDILSVHIGIHHPDKLSRSACETTVLSWSTKNKRTRCQEEIVEESEDENSLNIEEGAEGETETLLVPEWPFRCGACQRRYMGGDALRKHIWKQHNGVIPHLTVLPGGEAEGAAPYVCGACARQFQSFVGLRAHLHQNHPGKRPPGTHVKTKTYFALLDSEEREGKEHTESSKVKLKVKRIVKTVEPVSPPLRLQKKEKEKEKEKDKNLLSAIHLQATKASQPFVDILRKIQGLINVPALSSLDQTPSQSEELQDMDGTYQSRFPVTFLASQDKERDDFKFRFLTAIVLYLVKEEIPKECKPVVFGVAAQIWNTLKNGRLSFNDLGTQEVWKKVSADCTASFHGRSLGKNQDTRKRNILVGYTCQYICQKLHGCFRVYNEFSS